MSFPPGTKVVCIDATPIPIRVKPGMTGLDFTFPNGFIEEGRIYCVSNAIVNPDGSFGLHLVGLPILVFGVTCNWHSSRFRKVTRRKETQQNQETATQKESALIPKSKP